MINSGQELNLLYLCSSQATSAAFAWISLKTLKVPGVRRNVLHAYLPEPFGSAGISLHYHKNNKNNRNEGRFYNPKFNVHVLLINKIYGIFTLKGRGH